MALSGLRDNYYEVDLSGKPLNQKFDQIMGLSRSESDNALRVERILEMIGMVKLPEGEKRILDIGAGLGVFLARFLTQTSQPFSGVAIEPDPSAASHLRALRLFQVDQRRIEDATDLGSFRVVTLNKVLEHIDNPIEFLRNASKFLCSDASLLYVEVPDIQNLSEMGDDDNSLGPLHNHLWSPKSLTTVLQKASLTVLRTSRLREPSGKLSVFAFAAPSATLTAAVFPSEVHHFH